MTQIVECNFKVEGNGPALVLIHGVGSTLANWQPIVNALKDEFECITYDLRGHGKSPRPQTPYSLEMMVADLEQLRDRLGLQDFHVAGHSLGGMIASAYALEHSSRVASLALISTAAGRTDEEKSSFVKFVEELETHGPEPLLDILVDRWFTPQFVREQFDTIEERKRQVLANDPDVFASVFRIYATTEMARFLHQIKAPALVMTGEDDAACNPRVNRFIANSLPNAELRILPGLRHSILLEAPQVVASNLRSFFTAQASLAS